MHSLFEFTHSLIPLLAGPVLYFAIGLPWAIATKRIAWAPLWGVGVIGLTAEVSYMLGLPVQAGLIFVGAMHLLALLFSGLTDPLIRAEAIDVFLDYARLYAFALIPLVAAPFAIPGGWGGDWSMGLDSGLNLLNSTSFDLKLLARPPLFGAAATPLLLIGPTMAGYQAFCAIGSACALQVFRTGLRPSVNAKLIWILAGSMFFMQITANAWPKFLAAAFILASWQTLGTERRGRFVLAGVMLGFGLAMHQSGVLFIPILMVRCWSGRLEWSRFILAAALMLGIAGLLIVPWELHTILRYGWESKIHANPAVGQRLENIPMWLNALLVGVTTLLAWGPVDIAIHWASAANPFAPSRISKDLYWMATSICNSGAGSLLGLMLPWWVALGTREMARKISAFGHSVDVKVAAAFAFALAGQMLLNPFYSADGSLQTGFVPVGLALTIWFANELSEMDAQKTTAVLRKIVWLSAGPWLVFNLMLTAGLVTSGRMRSGFLDSDLQLLDTRAMVSLGMGCFPWLQCSLALTVYLLVRQPRPR